MGWAIGYDEHWQRDIGYGVPAYCDLEAERKEIRPTAEELTHREVERQLKAKLEAAEQALRTYGKHPSTCNKWWHHQIEGSILQNNKHCTCGLDALLASASRGEG